MTAERGKNKASSTTLHRRWWWGRYRIAARQQCTFTNDLRPSYDRLRVISSRDTRPGRCTRHLDEAGENSRADTVEFAALAAATALSELDLARVEGARELGDERAVEGVGAGTRGGRCTVQHARELVRVLEHDTRADWILCAIRQQLRERRHVLLEDTTCRLRRDVLHCRGERLAAPDGSDSRVS